MKRLLPSDARDKLREHLIKRLLPSAVKERRTMNNRELLDRFATGTVMPLVELERIEREVARDVDRCFPPFVYPDDPDNTYPDTPWLIEAIKDDLQNPPEGIPRWPDDDVLDDAAINILLRTDLELDRETRDYLLWALEQRYKVPHPPDRARERREFVTSMERAKALLRRPDGPALSAEAAEREIATCLGLSRDTLIQRIKRAAI